MINSDYSIEQYQEIAKREGIYSNFKWIKNYKRINEKYNLNFKSNPWLDFKIDGGIFSDYEYPIEEYQRVFKENGIISKRGWYSNFKRINEEKLKNYKRHPWEKFNLEGPNEIIDWTNENIKPEEDITSDKNISGLLLMISL